MDGLFVSPLPFDYVYDYSRDGARRSIEDSLQRLGLARVDVALIHDVVPRWHGAEYERRFRESMEGAYPALADLRREGVVQAIGVGVKDWDVCLRYLRAGDFDCVMLAGQYTLLCQDAFPELLSHCARAGVGVLVAAPFNSGILATGAGPGARYFYQPAPPEILARAGRLEAVCRRHGVPLAAAALQFPLAHPAVAAVVAGARSRAEVEANVGLLSQPILPGFWQELSIIHERRRRGGRVLSRRTAHGPRRGRGAGRLMRPSGARGAPGPRRLIPAAAGTMGALFAAPPGRPRRPFPNYPG